MKKGLLIFAVLLILTGCASMGINFAGSGADGREGKDYTAAVRAWNKKSPELSVVFNYRINGGDWKQIEGKQTGDIFEAIIPGSEMLTGTLEYYAEMTDAQDKVTATAKAVIRILNQEQARQMAVATAKSSISLTPVKPEFFFNDSVVLGLSSTLAERISDVMCELTGQTGKVVYPGVQGGRAWLVTVPPSHPAQGYQMQWSFSFKDDEFGMISIMYPDSPRQVSILDAAKYKEKIQADLSAAVVHGGGSSGTYYDPVSIRATLRYSDFLGGKSQKQQRLALVLTNQTQAKSLPMKETSPGVFEATVTAADMEQGWLKYYFTLSDSFTDVGAVSADIRGGSPYAIAYTGYEALREKRIAELTKSAFTHIPPEAFIEQSNKDLIVEQKDMAIMVKSMTLDWSPNLAYANINVFKYVSDGKYSITVPYNYYTMGLMKYRINVAVTDPKFGSINLMLPGNNEYYNSEILSKDAATKKFRAELTAAFSHAAPPKAVRYQPLTLTVNLSENRPEAMAFLFWRNTFTGTMNQIVGTKMPGGFTCTIPAGKIGGSEIFYYFQVTDVHPNLGRVVGSLKDLATSADFHVLVTAE